MCCVEIRGQTCDFCFHPWGLWGCTQVPRLAHEHLYPLSHLSGQALSFGDRFPLSTPYAASCFLFCVSLPSDDGHMECMRAPHTSPSPFLKNKLTKRRQRGRFILCTFVCEIAVPVLKASTQFFFHSFFFPALEIMLKTCQD